jgi:hypothetical protein
MPAAHEPTPVLDGAIPTNTQAASEKGLIAGAQRWVREAVDAWSEDDQEKVALMAPMAVELLGKATLWRENPVLLVQLNERHETSLFLLATRPDLAAKEVKTIGLQAVLSRLIKLLGDLPVAKERRDRMVNVRNGAVHVGSGDESRYVLLDCLSVMGVLLEKLGVDRAEFFGPHASTVRALLDERATEISRQVKIKMAQARARLTRLEDALGLEAFSKATGELEEQRWSLEPDDFVTGGAAVDVACPECGSKGRLFGYVDVSDEIDFDIEPMGGGHYESIPMSYWQAHLRPSSFACRVCNLQLHDTQELAEAGLRSRSFEVNREELGDFDLDDHIPALH